MDHLLAVAQSRSSPFISAASLIPPNQQQQYTQLNNHVGSVFRNIVDVDKTNHKTVSPVSKPTVPLFTAAPTPSYVLTTDKKT